MATNAPHPQHNSFDPEDVNDDGNCSPADALIIINAINANQTDTKFQGAIMPDNSVHP